MNFFNLPAVCVCMLLTTTAFGQTEKKKISAQRISTSLKIDGILNEAEWKTTPVADKFIALRPTPFVPEIEDNRSEMYFLYNDNGIYIGGYFHEKTKDSIAAELVGRDGFGNNDFAGVIFDTYNDKINGFEYFVTPLGEQFDAKQAPNPNGNSEDFSWNAVWQSAAKIHNDGWSFEMFLPYSAIRFGKKKVQDWGLNIVRRRQKSGQQLFWQSIDPVANGFLTQEGMLTGLVDIKPPLRLQFSPYFSLYHEKPAGADKYKSRVGGGADVKYGLNQAFTLDMTLIPDFGQVVTDNQVLNLTPFDVKFQENRPFFTEGIELFNKGNLFYSRRIGVEPSFSKFDPHSSKDRVIENPGQAKVINATKISGRSQNGLGIGLLNAVTQHQSAVFYDTTSKEQYSVESMPLTNYNVLVLDQTLKHNSSVSFVNTNVWRSGKDYDANVSSLLFDFNDKRNKWNVSGNASVSNLMGKNGKDITGYAHLLSFGKTSGKLNFSITQELYNKKYDKSDLGYFTNNNTMDQYVWVGYNIIKPKRFFNQLHINFNSFYSRLVSPIDLLSRKNMMYQNASGNVNVNGPTKKLWYVGMNINWGFNYNDFYEARVPGRVFQNKGRVGFDVWWNSNQAKKLSWGGEVYGGTGGVFKRKSISPMLTGKIRFSSKFSIDNTLTMDFQKNNSGWAANSYDELHRGGFYDTVYFSRRNLRTVENILSVKYSFTNKMGITLRARHYWSKVDPQQYYELDKFGNLGVPAVPFTKNVKQNYNFFSTDLVYTWQFAQGSFINIVWKDVSENFARNFERDYFSNFGKTINSPQSNSFSIRVIYFLDYLTAKNKLKHKA